MGVCLSVKKDNQSRLTDDKETIAQYVPLFTLKQNLLRDLNMSDDHFYQSFITYRFKNSLRKSSEVRTNVEILQKKLMYQLKEQ